MKIEKLSNEEQLHIEELKIINEFYKKRLKARPRVERIIKKRFPLLTYIYIDEDSLSLRTDHYELSLRKYHGYNEFYSTQPSKTCRIKEKMPETYEEFEIMKKQLDNELYQIKTAANFIVFNGIIERPESPRDKKRKELMDNKDDNNNI